MLPRALIVVVLAVAAAPMAGSQAAVSHARWQRVLTPAASAPVAEQCVVADAELYARAAPGLRDVRLVQDGRELPYAMDESHDDAGEAVSRGRAIFDPVAEAPLNASDPSSDAASRSASLLLPAHVPVERITVRSKNAPPAEAHVVMEATPRLQGSVLPEPETVAWTITPQQSSEMVTLGANLQQAAGVTVTVQPAPSGPGTVVLEMRRREICYRPQSASPVLLLLGDPAAEVAHYDYAMHFQPKAEPLLATMGPLRQNPAYRQENAGSPALHVSGTVRTAVMAAIVLGSLAVLAFAVVELRRR